MDLATSTVTRIPESGQDNYVYYKIHNIGCSPETLHYNEPELYWVEYTTGTPSAETQITGITSMSDIIIQPGESAVVEFLWATPTFTPLPVHACLIARINTVNDPKQTPGTSLAYTEGDNNQANRNIQIVAPGSGIIASDNGLCTPVLVGNYKDTTAVISFRIFENMNINPDFFKNGGRMRVNLGPVVYPAWVNGGMQGFGIVLPDKEHLSASGKIHRHKDDYTYVIEVVNPNATLGNIALDSNDFETIDVCYSYSNATANQYYEFDIEQKTDSVVNGGVGFNITTPDCPLPNAGADTTIDRLCNVMLNASPVIAGAVYTWRDDRTGAIIDTGASVTVSPMITTTYELELRTPDGCIDYDNVKVTVNADSATCRPSCGTPDYNNYTLNSSATWSNDTIVISGLFKVASGKILTVQNCWLIFTSGATLRVQSGGELVLENSILSACDPALPWTGIQVKGNKTTHPLSMTGCTITDALNSLYMETAEISSVTQNVFAGGHKGIIMNQCLKFNIEQNQFYDYDTALYAYNISNSVPAQINRNYFVGMHKGIVLSNTGYDSLQIHCNTFAAYDNYAIYASSGTVLSDFGDSINGAGNEFFSTSVLTNHQLYYDGTPITYYYDPSDSVLLINDTLFTATSSIASSDASCTQVGNLKTAVIIPSGTEITADIQKEDPVLSCIPNPATDHAKIIYELPEQTHNAEIRIVNLLGEAVGIYFVGKDIGSLELDCSGFKNGIYFYSLVADGKLIKTKKMIISR